MRKIRWIDRDRLGEVRSITEFACKFAGTISQLQIETRRAQGARVQRLALNDRGEYRAGTFEINAGKPRRKAESENFGRVERPEAERTLLAVSSFLAELPATSVSRAAGTWDILVVDGAGRAFVGSGPFSESSPNRRLSETIRGALGLDFDLFDGRPGRD